MKLCSWPGAPYGLALLGFLCNCATAVERRYYIAAVNINWDYTSAGQQRYEKDHYLLGFKLIQSGCLTFACLVLVYHR